jgi:hypothetical protein
MTLGCMGAIFQIDISSCEQSDGAIDDAEGAGVGRCVGVVTRGMLLDGLLHGGHLERPSHPRPCSYERSYAEMNVRQGTRVVVARQCMQTSSIEASIGNAL